MNRKTRYFHLNIETWKSEKKISFKYWKMRRLDGSGQETGRDLYGKPNLRRGINLRVLTWALIKWWCEGLKLNYDQLGKCFFQWAISGLFFIYFRSFSNKHFTISSTNQCEKCYVHPVSNVGIRTHDLLSMSKT